MRSRLVPALVLAALALGLVFAPAGATTLGSVPGPGPGHFSSDNVEWVATAAKPQHTGSSGGRLVGKYFYVSDPRGVWIYDVSNPAAPQMTGFVNVLQVGTGTALGQEDPDTNGKILLVDAVEPSAPSTNRLLVIDVSDKTAPKVVGRLAGTTDHTWTCVLDCTYAYGRSGPIIDLRDPANPKSVGNWRTSAPGVNYTHDFTEVRPGLLLASGQPSFYLDARANPLKPRVLTTIRTSFGSLGYHSTLWPGGGRDALMLAGTEIAPAGTTSLAGSDCQGKDSILATYDAREVVAADDYEAENPDEPRPAAEFRKLADWQLPGRGVYADGKAPFHVLYCNHWFDTHPDWDNGGLVAMASYEWGTRFLKVTGVDDDPETTDDGKLTEVGWFQPVGGATASAYWISKDVVYTLDYRRGLDVLRFRSTAS